MLKVIFNTKYKIILLIAEEKKNMKKALIAGAASVALAAMPMAGVFADSVNGTIYGSPIVDTLTLNTTEVCTLSRASAAHPGDTAANWTATTGEGVGASDQTYAQDVEAGQQYNGIAHSTFQVACNNAVGGYAVTVDTTNFVTGTQTQEQSTWQYSGTGAYASGASSWYLTSSAKVTGEAPNQTPVAIATGNQVWSVAAGTPVGTETFTITYNAYPIISQPQGSYTATATYTLVNL